MKIFNGLAAVMCVLVGFAAEGRAKRAARAPAASPRDVVQKYLAADFAGSRVFKDDRAATAQLVTWSEEPPWDQIIIVKRYELLKTKVRRKVAKTGVKFANLGELKGDVFYPDPLSEQVTFEANRKPVWKVDRPILVPHISAAAAEKFLREQQKALDPSSERYVTIERSLAALKALP